jgi:hypothetical protein
MSIGWNVEPHASKFLKFMSLNNLPTGTDRPRYGEIIARENHYQLIE